MSKRYTDQDVIKFVAEVNTYTDLISKLGLRCVSGNYRTIHKLIKKLNLDISHWTTRREKSSRAIDVDELRKIVPECKTLTEVSRKLGVYESGRSPTRVRDIIAKNKIDISHFVGNRSNLGKPSANKKDITLFLVNGTNVKSDYLKKRLISEGIFEHKCMLCGLSKWQGSDIPLELHHLNGDRKDNTLENIMIICPNCHAIEHKS